MKKQNFEKTLFFTENSIDKSGRRSYNKNHKSKREETTSTGYGRNGEQERVPGDVQLHRVTAHTAEDSVEKKRRSGQARGRGGREKTESGGTVQWIRKFESAY